MSSVIKNLQKKSMQTYTYSDIDGDNNRGVELNELQFAKLIIQECMKLNKQFIGQRISEIDLDMVYKDHFKINL